MKRILVLALAAVLLLGLLAGCSDRASVDGTARGYDAAPRTYGAGRGADLPEAGAQTGRPANTLPHGTGMAGGK